MMHRIVNGERIELTEAEALEVEMQRAAEAEDAALDAEKGGSE